MGGVSGAVVASLSASCLLPAALVSTAASFEAVESCSIQVTNPLFSSAQTFRIPFTIGLLREHHDEVGRFFAALQPEGAAAAAALTGLSLQAELSLAIQRGQFKQCALIFPQLLAMDMLL